MALGIENFLFATSLSKLAVRFFLNYLIELRTTELNDEMLGFLEFCPNIQRSIKWWKKSGDLNKVSKDRYK